VLGKTVVRAYDGAPEMLVSTRDVQGVSFHGMKETYADLRDSYEISHDHGANWQKAEKEVEG
jgi:hypothetical protein